ncbi:prepilin-type N-terminal cleavage/methylation domain-containing protein [Patescibacteria group bacterium]|nr:prepilin-type N-terminal cleavage/methylation domain-containing protein [Patescibacteria group bacterium]MBU1754901.1 prepilin-type N-terminal cleavage/methylation domain-containing protein [Patescibacteria group bacterium]
MNVFSREQRGFTLIELLVVIAIIGILSSVVLASLNTARNRGADAAVKSDLSSVRAQAELYYDSNSSSYASLCTDTTIASQTNAAATAGAGNTTSDACFSSATAWVVTAPLKSTNQVSGSSGTDYWCVDSTGASKVVDSAVTAVTTCP